MAEIEDDPENFSRCSFGPAEILMKTKIIALIVILYVLMTN